jgi:hypothetical protein
MADKGLHLPKATSTGTTIVGCLFKDGIILGADTRATEGEIVADKNCEKVCTFTPSICDRFSPWLDTLYNRLDKMLWCGNSCGYGIYDRPYLFQHGTARSVDWEEASSGNGDDNAETDVVQVSI